MPSAFGEIIYQDIVYSEGYEIELFVVDEKIEFEWCHSPYACSLYGYVDAQPYNAIVILDTYLDDVDPWGYTVLMHELMHIWCQCNFHALWRIV